MSEFSRMFWNAQAAQFCADRPDIVAEFNALAWQLIGEGYDRFSADAIVHQIRWRHRRDREPVRLNNNHVAYLARLWVEAYPAKARFFELRGETKVEQEA